MGGYDHEKFRQVMLRIAAKNQLDGVKNEISAGKQVPLSDVSYTHVIDYLMFVKQNAPFPSGSHEMVLMWQLPLK